MGGCYCENEYWVWVGEAAIDAIVTLVAIVGKSIGFGNGVG